MCESGRLRTGYDDAWKQEFVVHWRITRFLLPDQAGAYHHLPVDAVFP